MTTVWEIPDLFQMMLSFLTSDSAKDLRLVCKNFNATCKTIDWSNFILRSTYNIKETWGKAFPNTTSIEICICSDYEESDKNIIYLLQEHKIYNIRISSILNKVLCDALFHGNILRVLDISGCCLPNLTPAFLKELKFIKVLNIAWCHGIDDLNYLEGNDLEILDIQKCSSIRNIPFYPKLRVLNISRTGITILPITYEELDVLYVVDTLIDDYFFINFKHIGELDMRMCPNITDECKLFFKKSVRKLFIGSNNNISDKFFENIRFEIEELEITGCDRITGIYLHKLGIKNLFASGCSRIVNQSLALKNIIELHIQGPLITTDGLMLLGENIKILKMINVSELNIGLANLCKLESLTLIMCKDIHNLTLLINLKKLDIFN